MSGSSFWLILPIFACTFYAISSVLQNYCVDTAFPKKRAGAFVATHIIQFLICILLVVGIFGRAAFMMPLANTLGMMLAGAINVIGSIYYYKALQSGDTMDIAIYGEIGPFISLGLGVTILGQMITLNQGLAFIFIMCAALLIVFSNRQKKQAKAPRNLATIGFVAISCFFSVLSDVIFVYFLEGTRDYNLFAQSFFYFEMGSLLITVVALICLPSWRRALKKAFNTRTSQGRLATSAMVVDNLVTAAAEIIYKLALIIAPAIALLSVVGNVSKLIASLILAVVLGKMLPKLAQAKKITKKMLYHYLLAAGLIIIGVLVMNG